MLIASFAFAWMSLVARYLEGFHPLQVVFFRVFGSFIFLFPYMLIKRVPVIGKNIFWLSARAILGSISLTLFFIVIQRIPLGSTMALRYTAPIFSVVFAFLLLKEKVTLWQWVALLISLVGALVMKGVDFRIDTLSFIMIMGSAVLMGGVFAIIRYLGSKEHHLTIINYFMVVAMLGSLFFISHWRLPVGQEWVWVSSIGILGLIGQLFFTLAFKLAETNTVAPIKYMELVYTFFLGYFFLNETYSIGAIIGVCLVLTGLLLNVWAKRKK